MSSPRMRRVNQSVRSVLAEELVDLKDPRLGMVTLTDVRTSVDLKHAEVFYTVLPDDEETRASTAEGLASAAPRLRRQLAAALRTKNVPALHFTEDPVPAQGRRIDELIEQARRQRDEDR